MTHQVRAKETAQKYIDLYERFLNAKDYASAESVIGVGIIKYPNNIQLRYRRAVFYHSFQGKFDKALGDYSKVIALDRGRVFPKAYWRRGECFYKLSFYELAVKDYTKCLELLPGYGKVFMKRAMAYAKLGQLELAVKDLKTCMELEPKYAHEVRLLLNKLLEGKN